VAGTFSKKHKGVDIRCPTGTPVVATADGVVVASKRSGRGGLTVKVSHGEYTTNYAHLSRAIVRKGDFVKAGQRIAYSGSSGRVTGPHLHFEIWQSKLAKDPLDFAYELPVDPFLAPPNRTVSANGF
jgi:murein DD-endopeptidase